ncbi:MAG TPA: RDD family protein [Candidatus Dormibacteraeota bacterium]|nr:RDD family protein [Candidatus Dormibacteraeota bacterium]
MEQPLPDSELIVSTPERVSFGYQVAGLGTRAIAQILDLLIVTAILIVISIAAAAAATMTSSSILADLIVVIGFFLTIFGYFWASEAMWSGQTLGKKAFRLRAVGDRGEPLTWVQAGIRNVVRIVDFLPYGYGIGVVVLFVNGKGKRLGDLAAGTIVVKDSDHVWLWQLPGARPQDLAQTAGPQIPQSPPGYPPYPPPPPPLQPAAPTPPVAAAASQGELVLRSLDPELRRFVSTYARRRPWLTLDVRVALASTVQEALRRAQPDTFERQGPLATLDHLADLDRG